jgi:hypothetical protein
VKVRILLFNILCCLAFGCGCSQNNNDQVNGPQAQLDLLKDELKAQENEISSNKLEIKLLANYTIQNANDVSNALSIINARDLKFTWAAVDARSKGYGFLDSNLGRLLISTDGVENYMDGYKVHLRIGNTTAADIVGFELIYNLYNSTNFFGTERTKTNTMVIPLLTGKWNPVDLVVAPASADELRNLRLRIETKTLSLANP